MAKEEVFIVNDMKCNACKNTVSTTLSNIDGVSNIEVDLDTKEVKLEHDDEVDVEELLSALDNVGFPATIKKKP